MVRILCAFTLMLIILFCLVAGATVVGMLPIIAFDRAIEDAIKVLAGRVAE